MKKLNVRNTFLILGLTVLFSVLLLSNDKQVYAATKVEINSVDYYNENIVINNDSNTKFYFATDTEAANNKWDVIPADSGSTTTIDFSWLSASAENYLMVKGNADTDPVRLIIRKKPEKLNISINYTDMDKLSSTASIASIVNIMSTEGTGSDPIDFSDLEWRKGDNGQWQSSSTLTVSMLNKFLIRGTYVYFRICAVNDNMSGTYYPDGSNGRRFSDPQKIRIVAKTASMVYGIDGEKFTAAIGYGKEYKVTVTYPGSVTASSDWIQVTDRTSTVPLATLANCVTHSIGDTNASIIHDGETVAFPEMLIQVRKYATDKAASSKITNISLDSQRTLTKPVIKGVPADDAVATGDDNIYVSYGGNQYLTLYVPLASTTLPYEYCVVKPGSTFNLSKLSWTTITKGTGVKVLASKAVDGGILYIRQKEIKYKAATDTSNAVAYELASTYETFNINYPAVPAVEKTSLTYVKGYPAPLVFNVQLNVNGKLPYETAISSIKLGTKEIGFTSESYTLPSDSTVQCLKVTLNGDDVKLLANCSIKPLTITFANGTVNKISVKLTVKSPTLAGSLIASAAKGTASGTTAVTVSSVVGSGDSLVYIVSSSAVSGKYIEDTIASGNYHAFTSGADIAVTAGQYVTVYEISTTSMSDAASNIKDYKCIQITSDLIQ